MREGIAIMKTKHIFVLAVATALAPSLMACAAARPSRNGVFNENSYLRKEFLVRSGQPTGTDSTGKPTFAADPGWFMKATITQTSTPNPLAPTAFFPGAENNGAYVRFVLSQDQVKIVNMRELSDVEEWKQQKTRVGEVVDAWPAQHVDIKYRVNLDGEKTNFLEENQELDWQTRQWVKVQLGKNDMSDLMTFGPYARMMIQRCTEPSGASESLVPDSLHVDEKNNYFEWEVEHSFPIRFDDEACVQSYGEEGLLFQKLNRQALTLRVKYSFVRAKPVEDAATDPNAYQPLEIGEKDPIRRKYGAIAMSTIARDGDSQMIAARELALRFNPRKDIHFFLAPGYPEKYKYWLVGKDGDKLADPATPTPSSLAGQTNAILAAAGRTARVFFWNFDTTDPRAPGSDENRPRQYGDIRYSFIRWESDIDTGSPFIGVAQFVPDPRTGELLSASINLADFPLKDFVVQRIDAYLKTVGTGGLKADGTDGISPEDNPLDESKEWKDLGPCQDGDVVPVFDDRVTEYHNQTSSLFQKMQEYLGKPVGKQPADKKYLSPHDFVPAMDKDFFKAYYRLLPYYIFADPEVNQFVVPEGGGGVYNPGQQMKALEKEAEFHKLAGKIDKGIAPYEVAGKGGATNALKFLNDFRDLTQAHRDYNYKQNFVHGKLTRAESAGDLVSFVNMMKKNGRHCVNGRYETKKEWVNNLIESYHALTLWHEFGHIMGLEHNFMGSVDEPNYPRWKDKGGREHIGMYQSTVMEYNNTVDRVFWKNDSGGEGWGPYDKGAIAFIYGNDTATRDKSKPVNVDSVSGQISDSAPWKDPLGFKNGKEISFLFCSHQHLKYTPLCRQFDSGSRPSEIIANEIDNYEWQYRWRSFRMYRKVWDNSQYANTPGNLIPELRRFLSLWGFSWSPGELAQTFRRLGVEPPPEAPNRQNYYSQLETKFNEELSESNQMVAAFHKAIIQQASGERPYKTTYDNFYGDVTQQGIILDKLFAMQGWVGLWPSDNYDPNQAGSYLASYSSLGDASFRAVAEDTVSSMIGEQYYDVYPYFRPLAVLQFAQDTHSPSFNGRYEVRDLIGARVFFRKRDYLDFFRDLAVTHGKHGCTDINTCTYDPTVARITATDEVHSDVYHEFIGPDGRRYSWVYIEDRNVWMFCDQDRNTAMYKMMRDYNAEVVRGEDDGVSPGMAYPLQLPLKYFADYYGEFN
jgi:hypothetical protein